jgi:hypothetical protein
MTPTGTSISKISAQQIGERQRGQRVSTQVGEVCVRSQLFSRHAKLCGRGPADGLQHRRVGAALPQRPQLVDLTLGQLRIQLFQKRAVVLLELGPRQLADAGEQAVFDCERRGLHDEVAWNLIGLHSGRFGDVL